MLENYEESFKKSDLEYDKFWLQNNQYVLNQYKTYDDNLYKDANELLDLFCIQILRNNVYCFSEESDFNIEAKIYDFRYIITDLQFDFNLFVLLSGEDYINSDYYANYEDYETNQYNIIYYLISIRFYDVLLILKKHYGDSDKLLLNLLDGLNYKERYLECLSEIETFEDMFDNVDVVKLHQWKEDGFNMNGE